MYFEWCINKKLAKQKKKKFYKL